MRESLMGWLPAFLGRIGHGLVSAWGGFRAALAEWTAVAGAALVAFGVGDIYGPAGLITGGALLILGAIAAKRSGV
ncbi:MAG TPA: hypothetical protein VM677_28030 [Actinokineospora sp.]|jgi:hypothetical protein|nr:hypothetical protein [Actinokineospora sp.]